MLLVCIQLMTKMDLMLTGNFGEEDKVEYGNFLTTLESFKNLIRDVIKTHRQARYEVGQSVW